MQCSNAKNTCNTRLITPQSMPALNYDCKLNQIISEEYIYDDDDDETRTILIIRFCGRGCFSRDTEL